MVDLLKFKSNKKILSVHLFQLLGAETHVYVKAGATCVFGSAQKCNFLEKVAFWAKAKNALRTCKIYGALEVHKAKSPCAFQLSVGFFLQLPNYHEVKSPQFSCLLLIPLISSLCSHFVLKLTHAIKLIKPQQ